MKTTTILCLYFFGMLFLGIVYGEGKPQICFRLVLNVLYYGIIGSFCHFLTGGNVGGGSMDSVNMGMQRYHDSSSSRSSSILRHPPPLNHRHQNHHVATPPMQGLRGHNLNLPHVTTEPSYRLPSSSSRGSTRNPSQNGMEIGRRQPGPIPQTGFRIYRPHQGVISETALRHHNLAHWRVLGVDVISLPFYAYTHVCLL